MWEGRLSVLWFNESLNGAKVPVFSGTISGICRLFVFIYFEMLVFDILTSVGLKPLSHPVFTKTIDKNSDFLHQNGKISKNTTELH